MRRLGDARIEALALAIVESLAAAPELRLGDRGAAVATVVEHLKSAFQVDRELDRAVRARIASLEREVPEGGREWDLLYRQYLEQLSRQRS